MPRLAWAAALAWIAIATPAVAEPYTVPNTQVLELSSRQTGADYQLFVALPPDYAKTKKSYPVVYMLDADYSFAIVRNVVQHFVERDDLPPMILVAIAYPGAATNRETYKKNRTRDYTPVYAPDGGYGAEYQKVSGGAAKFRSFIATELVPLIERRFRADRDDRTIIGHSYGGLFGTYVLLTEPDLFKRYVIVSPSLWYAKRVAFSMEQTAADSGIRPQAKVFFGVGELESQVMSDDLTDMYRRLKNRNNRRLDITLRIFEEERHNSVFPVAVTRGLLTVFDSPSLRVGHPPSFTGQSSE
jgi:predicted alpha/beta superfamily hydrolase